MDPLVVAARAIPCHCNYIDRPMGSGVAIDYRRGCNAHLRTDLTAGTIVARGFAGSVRGDLPELRAGISIVGVNGVVLCRNVHYVVRASSDVDSRKVQRLGKNRSVARQGPQKT